MSTSKKLPSYPEYLHSKRVWIPREEGNQALFIVKIPPDLMILDEQDYLELMKVRFEWMYSEWIEHYNDNKREVQTMLYQYLRRLHPFQEAPDLFHDEQEEKTIGELAWEWANTLLEFNETWREWFGIINPDIEFPVDLSDLQPNTEALEQHDNVNLEEFLIELTSEMKMELLSALF